VRWQKAESKDGKYVPTTLKMNHEKGITVKQRVKFIADSLVDSHERRVDAWCVALVAFIALVLSMVSLNT
jgi:hypothetical protein